MLFPYFGESGKGIMFTPESETVRLLDFRSLGIDVPDRDSIVNKEERDDIRGILVHQARYTVFDTSSSTTEPV